MLLGQLLHESRGRWPDKVVIWFAGRGWTYAALDDASDRVAAALAAEGVRAGDRVGLFMPNCVELFLGYFGLFKLGAIAVPLNYRYKQEEARYALEHCGATGLLAHQSLLPEVAALPLQDMGLTRCYLVAGGPRPPFRPFDHLLGGGAFTPPALADTEPAAILYTSGSTARPKGVTHTHASLTASAAIQAETFQFTDRDVHLIVTAACHIAASAGQFFPAIQAGGTCVLTHLPRPEEVVRAVETHGVTRTQMLPAGLEDVVEYLERNPSDKLGSWRACTAGGDVIPLELQHRFRAVTGFDVTELYGMTEAVTTFTNPPFGPKRPGSFGRPVVRTEGHVVDDHGRELPDGEVGELVIRSPSVMRGYWDDPHATADAIRDGWLYTGDLARRDADGYFWFAGRKKEIIIRGGSNISPMEVESVFDAHPAVHLTCVLGRTDTHFGQVPVAYVQFRDDAADRPSPEELRRFVADRLAAYKVPEEIHVLEQIPLNATGKVDRQRLHALVARG